MTDRNISIVIMRAEQLAAITLKLKHLEWQAAGYERLKAASARQKGRITELESRVASADETSRQYWAMIQNGRAEVRHLTQKLAIYRDVDHQYGAIERQSEALQEENERLSMAANALEARIEILERQLAAADQESRELKALLVLKALPAGSLDNVLQMARAA